MIFRFSPAKVNLFFRVVSKRSDGFHEIASLYSAINLGDFITLQRGDKDSFVSNEKTLLNDSSNLVIRARDLFRTRTEIREPVAIELTKNIPIGRGLGGGSSNAATLLWMMNELFNRPLSLAELTLLAARVGSDSAFFFSKSSAYCTGRGERLEEVDFSFNQHFWIAKPDEWMLSTPKVYALCQPGEVSTQDPREILEIFRVGKSLFVNDLEPAAFRAMPLLKEFKESLKELGFSDVVMTGSGTAFICFGNVDLPKMPRTTFYRVNTIKNENWYESYSSERTSPFCG